MQLSIIIVNYNTFKLTCDCIRSLLQFVKGPGYEIIVVDNASPGDDPEQFLDIFPQIRLVRNPENNGFAKGNNLGISHAIGEVILLLNSDTYLTEDCISPALQTLRKDSSIAALGVRIVYPDGAFQHTARRFRSIRNELLDLIRPILYLLPYKKRAILMLNQYFKGDLNTECDWVSGAFMMFPGKIVKELRDGKLDERFFMYGEDHLWGYQFKQLGYRNYFLSENTVVHIANASTDPGKQLQLLKTIMAHEMEIMAYRKGKGLYYCLFGFIFKGKEYLRYYIKLLVQRIFRYKIR